MKIPPRKMRFYPRGERYWKDVYWGEITAWEPDGRLAIKAKFVADPGCLRFHKLREVLDGAVRKQFLHDARKPIGA